MSKHMRTSVVHTGVARIPNFSTLRQQAETHWNIRSIQGVFPSLEPLFKLENVRVHLMGLPCDIQSIVDASTILFKGVRTPVWRKTSLILPIYKLMRGNFGSAGLPLTQDMSTEKHERMHSPHNSAYINALASVLLSEACPRHFPKVFGTFTGIASTHRVNISDDYEDLSERPWFFKNIGHFFELSLTSLPQVQFAPDESEVLTIESIPLEPIFTDVQALPDIEEEDPQSEDAASVSEGYIFDIFTNTSDGSCIGGETEEDEFAFAVFKDVPVQTTVQEVCEGVVSSLFIEGIYEQRIAWLTQLMFALAFAQRTFGFVHNDLHSNNVMFVSTPEEYFYYSISGKTYKVPTFGKQLKLIDFERSLFSVKLAGMREPRFFMSDQFGLEDEAAGQYNCEPFYTPKYMEIKPNPSFDLVRFATSLFWDCFPDGPSQDPFSNILVNWMTLPDGTSVLFRGKDNFHERYAGFTLYKVIARFSKGITPRAQIEKLCEAYVVTNAQKDCMCVEN